MIIHQKPYDTPPPGSVEILSDPLPRKEADDNLNTQLLTKIGDLIKQLYTPLEVRLSQIEKVLTELTTFIKAKSNQGVQKIGGASILPQRLPP